MLYLIKSIKWTKHYGKEMYWGPDENGYVSVIANAGFYNKKEAEKIVRLSSGNAEMIPVTKDILNKAYEQLKHLQKEVLDDRKFEENRHKNIVKYFDKRDDLIDNDYNILSDIAKQLNI